MAAAISKIVRTALAGLFLVAAGAHAAAQPLVPHRAIYDLVQVELSGRSGLRGITGLMSVDFDGSVCDGYTTNVRLAMNITRRRGRNMSSDLRMNSWEDGKGRKFTFSNRQKINNRLTENSSGRVQRGEDGTEGHGVMLKPRPQTFKVPAKAIFPSEFSLRVLEAAKQGKRIYKTLVFDGTDTTKSVRAVALIGKRKRGSDIKLNIKNPTAIAKLNQLPAWVIDVSYFPLDKAHTDQTPSYRSVLEIYQNGVVAGLRMEYSDFTLRGELKAIELKPAPKC
jgi:hypothetical protein